MATVKDVVLYPALRLAGVLRVAGRGANPSELADALGSANRMVDTWNTQRLFIFTVRNDRYTLSPSKPSYTIGPSGADFTAPRPVRIDNANIILTGSTPEIHIPLAIWDDDQWARVRVTQLPVTLPAAIYNDGSYPNSRLYFWGYPNAGNDLELFTWSQLSRFAAIGDTVAFPPGYEDAIVSNLAVHLSAQFGTPLRPDLYEHAKASKAAIKGLNSSAPKRTTLDAGMPDKGRSSFNYRTGNFR